MPQGQPAEPEPLLFRTQLEVLGVQLVFELPLEVVDATRSIRR
ncbi:hypothetical protein [Cryobacterium algoricola]|nr:hypothetical protein [Cryobacterium algoricola]